MSVRKHLIHVKSNQLMTGSTTEPKSPNASDILYGEIAINYLKDKERIFIKNSDDEIVPFYSGKVIDDNEAVTAQALSELDGRINDIEESGEVVSQALGVLNNKVEQINAEKDDFNNMESVTYSELKSKRGDGELVPGKHYRITDYVTTTAQENTQSAGHQFDVVVIALDESTLSENAHAMLHDGDTYFSESGADLNAWELKYCLDNDTTRFAWADDTNGKGVIYYMKDEWNNECPYDFKNIQFKRWAITSVKDINNEHIGDLEDVFNYDSENNPICFGYQDSGYEMGSGSCTIDSNTSVFYYTLSRVDSNGNIMDNSIVGNTMGNDENLYQGVINNVFKPSSNGINEVYGTNDAKTCLRLCDNVFVSTSAYDGGMPYGVFGNTFGTGCYHNTFGNSCYSNTFGNYFYYNTFGNYFRYNTFGNECYNNSFGNDCWYNTFGNRCGSNTFGNSCNRNSFGNYVSRNTFGNGCGSNTFGNNAYGNTFGNSCGSNTFGNDCWYNTFGNGCGSNTFGNSCGSNTFGNECGLNTFGNECYNNSFGNDIQFIRFVKKVTNNGTATEVGADYINWCVVENGNKRIKVTFSSTTSSSSVAGNITITQGVNNATYNGTNNSNWVNITNSDIITLNNSTKTTQRTIYRPSTTVDISI